MTASNRELRMERLDTGQVDLQVAAVQTYLPIVRAVAGNLAMIEDYDLDAISDFKLAVDEVCSTLINVAGAKSQLDCQFSWQSDRICFRASVDAVTADLPKQDSFGWRILTTLADGITSQVDPSGVTEAPWRISLEIAKHRGRSSG